MEQSRPGGAELARHAQAEARSRIEQDVAEIAARFGARTLHKRAHAAGQEEAPVLGHEAVAALEAAHELEVAAHALVGEYIRKVREAGPSWEVIGDALDLLFHASANKIGVGEQAHDYALSYETRTLPRRYIWQCPACHQTITDRGSYPEVPQQEEGHDPGCIRRNAQIAEWQRWQSGR